MSIQVVTHDVGTHVTVVDHEWPDDCDKVLALKAANEWAERHAQQDKSTDHVVYVREV
jgi:hypothetical protein